MNLKKFTALGGIFIAVAALGYFAFVSRGVDVGELDQFAQCLAEKGATMYGAAWCPHCQNEKRAFGSSFRFIPYVECPDDPNRCLAEGIEGYPTWIFSDGRRFEGEQGVEKLSEISGCSLDQKTAP